MRQIKTAAIILRRTNYGESDRVLNLLTPNGKISAIAKGVRKPKSKLAGGLELFAVSDLNILNRQNNELGLLTSARLTKFYSNILKDYDRLQLGYDFIKRVNRATETVTDAEFYILLKESFEFLDNLNINPGLIELWFLAHLGSLLGTSLNLRTDIEGKSLKAEQKYNYDFSEQAFYEHQAGSYTPNHIKILRLISANKPPKLALISGVDEHIAELIQLYRYQMEGHIG